MTLNRFCSQLTHRLGTPTTRGVFTLPVTRVRQDVFIRAIHRKLIRSSTICLVLNKSSQFLRRITIKHFKTLLSEFVQIKIAPPREPAVHRLEEPQVAGVRVWRVLETWGNKTISGPVRRPLR